MIYKTYDFLNKKISKIIFGCDLKMMHQGEDVTQLLDAVYNFGINTFDTARGYGHSEEILGKWIKNKNREDIVIISKCCLEDRKNNTILSKENIINDVNTSVSILGTYIDILYLHRDNHTVPVNIIIDTLNELINEGKIKAIGVSNWKENRIKEANKYAASHNLHGFVVSSPAYSLANMEIDCWGGGDGCVSIQGDNNKKERDFYIKYKIPVFPYSSLARGFFAGKYKHDDINFINSLKDDARIQYYHDINIKRLERAEILAKKKNCTVSQINISYMINQEFDCHPVIASSNINNIKNNIEALDIKLTKDEINYLYDGKE